MAKVMWSGANERAKANGLIFELEVAPIEARVRVGFCEATGLPFDFTPPIKGRTRPFGPTIDRVDNARGYTWDNIRVVCNIFNLAKSDFSEADLLTMAHALATKTRV